VSCLQSLLFETTKLLIGVEVVGGFLAGDGLVPGHASQLLLVEHGTLTAHEAVLVGFNGTVGEERWVADVEDAAAVVLVSIVAVGTVQAAERGGDAA